jgi:hypothetical protein
VRQVERPQQSQHPSLAIADAPVTSVISLEQHRADQPNNRGFVGEDADDEWQLQHRYMQVEVMAELSSAAGADDPRRIPCAA